MANAVYQFVWHEYCAWFVEMAKPALLSGVDPEEGVRTRAVLLHVLEQALRLLHPVMPFLTEELWQRLPHDGDFIALAAYPVSRRELVDEEAEREIGILMEIVNRVRNIRAELNIDPGRRVPLLYHAADPVVERTLSRTASILMSLARLEKL